jgi:hypothetical protein
LDHCAACFDKIQKFEADQLKAGNLIVAIMAVSVGTTNALGWSTVLIYFCGAVGSVYFLTAGKAQQRAA